jgi:hypothetical protein
MTVVRIVNIIPAERSEETNLDWQPSIAVNAANPNEMAIVALTPPDLATEKWPIFYSADGGETWQMNFNLPGEFWDQSVGFCTSGELYRAIATGAEIGSNGVRTVLSTPEMYIVRTANPSSASALPRYDLRTGIDQPFVNAITLVGLPNKDQLYVGYNDHSHLPKSATVDLCLDALTTSPTFGRVRLDPRSPKPMDGYEVRPVAHLDGTVYVAYKSWRSYDGTTVTTDVVVARDDSGGTGGFTDLKDPGDLKDGRRVATEVLILDPQYLGEQRLDNDLDIAVDPTNSQTLYIVWGDNAGPNYTLRVRRSLDAGATWTGDLLTISNADLACLAINSDGRVGFMYQKLVSNLWETHFRRTTDSTGENWDDLILARTSTAGMFADYGRVIAVGKDFYGVFPAWNTPNPANFPSTPPTSSNPNGAKFLRNTTKNAPWQLLGGTGQTILGSVDPFFYMVQDDGKPNPPTDLDGSVE